ncbi:ScbR family autoregulator-binding transcription factor [Streptomyces sp. NPDC037389]|uniref:ScbR family autoregulator-binding transcription factor n=1 Tax=Streptomyces sp. NPDC037389 TaxID=3155369 RepID=UPI0033D3283F
MARPRQDRAVRTRAAILHAAAEVFDEFGFSGASVSKIIKRADATQGAMYFHFKSKEDLARAVMNEQGEGIVMPEGEAGLQHLIDITLHLATELQTNVLLRAGVRLAVEQGEFGVRDDTAYQDWAARFHEELVAARDEGELLPDVDERELAWVLVSCYTGTQLFSQVSTNRADLPERVALLWRYLLPGVATPETRARLVTVPGPAGKGRR